MQLATALHKYRHTQMVPEVDLPGYQTTQEGKGGKRKMPPGCTDLAPYARRMPREYRPKKPEEPRALYFNPQEEREIIFLGGLMI